LRGSRLPCRDKRRRYPAMRQTRLTVLRRWPARLLFHAELHSRCQLSRA
jgi:hypothetical protein